MSWNSHMEVHYGNTSYPYDTAGSFMEYFEGLTYEHVNFIFSGASNAQENVYPSMTTSFYKFGLPEPENTSYYGSGHLYEANICEPQIDEYTRPSDNSLSFTEHTTSVNTEREGSLNTTARDSPIECPRRHHSSRDYQVLWQDNVDPDNMTYEELLELGEAVGTHSRGLSQEMISLLPISKYKCGFFSRKKSRDERCVICQMEYKRGDKRITLPCKHVYHAGCGTRWLSINKACPICYTEVFADASKQKNSPVST
ncbi:E3 ubiquitin ligase BIG BROTHER-like [Quillaja saponaria]|uniref:E3 ubiquitin ligase BIG BROTHER-like n=1 Tax=Quillaja saponaria TaxID=32244 RepID=A0AAD7VMD9_QUISA|nr:E3 ubiquitin ligase BIG BROTHER-like [Quillaja saponaria]